MRYIVRITNDRPPDVTIRAWRKISTYAFMQIGVLWDRQFKMRHFEAGASGRYGYQARSPKYEARKRRMAAMAVPKISRAAANPLIYTGATRRAVQAAQIPHAYPSRVTINMATPSYFAMRPRAAGRPSLGDEATRIIQEERVACEQKYVKTVEDELAVYRVIRVTTLQ